MNFGSVTEQAAPQVCGLWEIYGRASSTAYYSAERRIYFPERTVIPLRLRRFLWNASLLAVVQMLMRLMAVSFNAFVSRKIGAEAMGLFTLVMSVYGLSVTFAASGVNLAAVRLTAAAMADTDPPKRIRGVIRGCILYSLLFGISASLILFAASDFVGMRLLCDARTIPSLRALAISLPAISLSSALAGYFTGVRRIYKNAVVSVTEQLIKISLTTVLLLLFVPAGIEYACLAVVGGSAIAEGFSLCTAALLYFAERRGGQNRARIPIIGAFRDVFRCAFPTAVGSYARQGLLTAEHLAIPWGLRRSGIAGEAALASYGVLHGMVYPIIFFPSAILGAFSSLLVPEFAECAERGDGERIRRMAEKVMRTSLMFSIGTAGIFIAFSYEIGQGIYPGTDAYAHLAMIAPLIPVMYLDSAVDAMLKGLGEQMHSMKINIADSLLCLVLVLLLLPKWGLAGYFAVQYICELLNATLSISRLLTVTKMRPRVTVWVILPLCGIIFATASVRWLSGIPSVPLIGFGSSAGAR